MFTFYSKFRISGHATKPGPCYFGFTHLPFNESDIKIIGLVTHSVKSPLVST